MSITIWSTSYNLEIVSIKLGWKIIFLSFLSYDISSLRMIYNVPNALSIIYIGLYSKTVFDLTFWNYQRTKISCFNFESIWGIDLYYTP